MQIQSIMLLFGTPGPTEIIVILGVLVLLFGGKKIPELARGMGRGITEFKRGIHEPPKENALPKNSESTKEQSKDV